MSTLGAYRVLCSLLDKEGLPRPKPEWEFHHDRKWKIDYCWPDPDDMVALEVEGGVWTRGRHTRASGFEKDMEKYNALACSGYRLIRVQPKHLHSRETIGLIRLALLA